MTKRIILLAHTLFFISTCLAQTTSFDFGWRFHRGGAQYAESPNFDDSKWRKVDLPHDWSIEDLPAGQAGLPGTKSPFDPDAISQVSGGFTVGGTGWYRKTFTIPADQKGKRIHIQFDGVYMNADFWLNGHQIGTHPYGYTSFWFDITDKINYAGENKIAVQVKNEGQNSRWYTGSGIYRHVWLKFLDPVHVSPWGIYITTPNPNKINIKTTVVNDAAGIFRARLVSRIINSRGIEVAKTESLQNINSNSSQEFDHCLLYTSPSPRDS